MKITIPISIADFSLTDPISFTHQTSPANPAAGTLTVFAKSDDKLYTRSSGGVEQALGAGGNSGVKMFGAAGDGVTDDTVAIQAAINYGADVYLPRGRYRITDALIFSVGAQRIIGDGRTASVFVAGSDFNMSAAGVLVVSTPMEPAPQFIDIGVEMTQPDVSLASGHRLDP